MPMKIVADLPAETYARIKPDGYDVQFRLAERDGSFKILANGDMLGGLDLFGVFDTLWMADNIEAAHGWGPFLMGIALEWATEKGGGVFPHRCGIVPPDVEGLLPSTRRRSTRGHAGRTDPGL